MSSTNEYVRGAAARLAQARAALHLTQPAFAAGLGLSLRGYQNYERGDRSLTDDAIRAAWSTYGIDPVWLLTGEGTMIRGAAEPPPPRYGPAMPDGLAGLEERVGALLSLLAALPVGARDTVLAECHARAEAAAQLAELRATVARLTGSDGDG